MSVAWYIEDLISRNNAVYVALLIKSGRNLSENQLHIACE
jgi:hypothetical protein